MVANQAVVIAIAIIVDAVSFGPFPSCLPKIAKPVRHFANIPVYEKQKRKSASVNGDVMLGIYSHSDFQCESGALFDGGIGRFGV